MIAKATINGLMQGTYATKMRAGKHYIPVTIEVEENRMLFNFPYNKDLIAEVKESFEGRKYHGYLDGDGRKLWSAPITHRNLFQLEALQGKYCVSPYTRWENYKDISQQILNHCANRHQPLVPFAHQVEMVSEAFQAKWYLMAADMGTGKTLATILMIEMLEEMYREYGQIIWVGPHSALNAAKLEFRKWDVKFMPQFYTYDGLRTLVQDWTPGNTAPRVLVLDESSKCKGFQSKRSIAAQHMADSMRDDHGENCYITELSGRPAPKVPSDWWRQLEIVCPGFIREGNWYDFRSRLAHIEQRETTPGAGAYPHLKCWKDSESKCKHCGEDKVHLNHDSSFMSQLKTPDGQTFETHQFEDGVNEVTRLNNRIKGLVGVWLKKDCLDLPEKRYEIVELEPSIETLNAARMVVQTSRRGADALIRLRTLSDGFLYSEAESGEMTMCRGCKGEKQVTEYYEEENPDDMLLDEEVKGGFRNIYEDCPPDEDPITFIPQVVERRSVKFLSRLVDCYRCDGKGEVPVMERTITEVPCPKIDLLEQLLGEHEECGRLNIYAGFEGSIIRCVRTCMQKGWTVIKADGKGWDMHRPTGERINITDVDMLYAYQEQQDEFPMVAFVGQPGAAGMGLTLHAAPTTFFYSNDFVPDSREQAEDRGHRIGMDVVRGGRIIDCVHLPSDRKVINSLLESRNLQMMSLTGLKQIYQAI